MVKLLSCSVVSSVVNWHVKMCLKPSAVDTFDFQMCFAQQRRAIFHLSSTQLSPRPRSHKTLEKHNVSRLPYLCTHLHSDFLLTFFMAVRFHLSILSEGLASELPSIIGYRTNLITCILGSWWCTAILGRKPPSCQPALWCVCPCTVCLGCASQWCSLFFLALLTLDLVPN